ncbi:MAG TPA: hypothetical protein VG096_15365 [Bryobacteraceae bacterium]|jgi:tetratricopeptide (TPR) repeat protein|nr:hypothetical protein [Bryobacteraceae bacterium]
MRLFVSLILACWIVSAQDASAPPAEPATAPAPATPPAVAPITIPVVTVDVNPLAPPDLDTPYASSRDAARHRFQATLAELQSARNVKAGLQGFAEAFAVDRTYAAAVWNLGIIAAIAEKWEDALSAFEEAVRLDSGLKMAAAPQMERLRLIRSLEATPEGKRRRAYDDALYPILKELSKLTPAEAVAALGDIGKIDPKRWEAPALLAGLNGSGRSYDLAARFLEIAVGNAGQPAIKERLEKALEAAQRELRYAAARATADAAADRGEYDKAGDLYEKTWAVIPARDSNGMEAASAWLLSDDTSRAAGLLVRLHENSASEYAGSAAAMLKELEPIEPAAKGSGADARDFFRDAGPAEPVYISDLLPPIDQSEMELLARPLPKLVSDSEPVVLLATFSANPADVPQAGALPGLPPLRLAGENPWRELSQLRRDPLPSIAVDPAAPPQERGSIIVETAPADLRLNGTPIANPAPVELSVQPGLYRIGSGSGEREITVKPGAHLRISLH